MAKTFSVKTLGCKVNQYESQALREKLLEFGLKESKGEPADICVVNTCSVTQKADKESLEAVRQISRDSAGRSRIFVTGCSAQNNRRALESQEGIACVLENRRKEDLPSIISGAVADVSSGPSLSITRFHQRTRAFLKIQDGCDNGCSYCIIPKLRGPSCSRPLRIITDEAKRLAGHGYREIVLCGICLGDYGRDLGIRDGLVKVIEELEEIDGLSRIRLSSIEASDITQALIDKMARSRKLCRHLHIPFQSGDDKVLALMNRKVLSAGYLQLADRLRRHLPDIGITTDIMAGFPGEDQASFNNTLRFLKEIKPSRMHIFPFSPRRGTSAFGLLDKVKPQIIRQRVAKLKALSKELSLDFCQAQIGRDLNVLIESAPCRKSGFLKGYSGNYLRVYIARIKPIENTVVMAKAGKVFQDGLLADVAE
ncbi:tRNA (N(6)-L-threonylcarbamoyladenosine(37)-C(2))-methylthiotransferase MtaB [bacterium]|nr:MAG: tRNA (N(6)-L-threonylcarbamoyladenosine(37)-C(2))-methylthiotransferase MtaB [bacterium]